MARLLLLVHGMNPIRSATNSIEAVTETSRPRVPRAIRPLVAKEKRGVLVVRVPASLEISAADEWSASLLSCVATGVSRLVADLSAADFVSSAAWGGLVRVAGAARAHGGNVALAGLRPAVREAYQALGLSTLLSVHPAVEDAVDAVSRRNAEHGPVNANPVPATTTDDGRDGPC